MCEQWRPPAKNDCPYCTMLLHIQHFIFGVLLYVLSTIILCKVYTDIKWFTVQNNQNSLKRVSLCFRGLILLDMNYTRTMSVKFTLLTTGIYNQVKIQLKVFTRYFLLIIRSSYPFDAPGTRYLQLWSYL